MFKKLKDFVESIKAQRRKALEEKIAALDDDFARQISWDGLNCAAANFTTRKLKENAVGNLAFVPTIGACLFSLIFAGPGFLVLLKGLDPEFKHLKNPVAMLPLLPELFIQMCKSENIILFLFGMIFFVVGTIVLYYFTRPIYFDRSWKKFFKGYSFLPVTQVPFDDIYAIQILTAVSSKAVNYQMNMVLKNKERINIVSLNNKETAAADAQKISQLLGNIPVWNLS